MGLIRRKKMGPEGPGGSYYSDLPEAQILFKSTFDLSAYQPFHCRRLEFTGARLRDRQSSLLCHN